MAEMKAFLDLLYHVGTIRSLITMIVRKLSQSSKWNVFLHKHVAIIIYMACTRLFQQYQ